MPTPPRTRRTSRTRCSAANPISAPIASGRSPRASSRRRAMRSARSPRRSNRSASSTTRARRATAVRTFRPCTPSAWPPCRCTRMRRATSTGTTPRTTRSTRSIREQLRQNVAVYAVVAYLAAEADGDFGSAPGAFAHERRMTRDPIGERRRVAARYAPAKLMPCAYSADISASSAAPSRPERDLDVAMARPGAERDRERKKPDRVARTRHHGRGAERRGESEREENRAREPALPRKPDRGDDAGEHRRAR